MVEIQDRRTLTQNSVLISGFPDTADTDFAVRMTAGAVIPGLLPCSSQIVDGARSLCYETGDLLSIAEIFQGKKISQEAILHLLREMEEVSAQLERYLLDSGGLLLETKYIFADDDGRNSRYLYVPGRTMSFAEAFGELAEFILEHMDYTDRGAVLLGYGIYKRIQEGKDTMRTLLSWCVRSGEDYARERQERLRRENPGAEREPEHVCRGGYPPEDLASEAECEKEKTEQKKITKKRKKAKGEKSTDRSREERKRRKRQKKWIAGAAVTAAICITGYIRLKDFGYFDDEEPPLITVYEGYPAEDRVKNAAPNAAVWAGAAGTAVIFGLAGSVFWYRHQIRKERGIQTEEKRTRERIEVPDDRKHYDGRTAGEDRTICLQVQTDPVHKLVRQDNQEELPLNKETIHLGKDGELADYVILEPAVSRLHARLSKAGENWYVRDMGSTNGTRLNGRKLAPEEEAVLSQGDEIILADIPMLFL